MSSLPLNKHNKHISGETLEVGMLILTHNNKPDFMLLEKLWCCKRTVPERWRGEVWFTYWEALRFNYDTKDPTKYVLRSVTMKTAEYEDFNIAFNKRGV